MNFPGQYLFLFPEKYQIDMQQLYDQLIAYIQQQNSQPFLQQQITNLQNQLSNYLLIVPQQDTNLNQSYKIKSVQIIDLQANLSLYLKISDFNNLISNYLLINPSVMTSLNSNYIVTTSQITDFNTIIANYLKTNDFNTQIAKYQLITDFNTQITNYLKVTDFTTQIANYLKINDFNTQIANYLKVTDFNTQIANYLKTNDFNTQIVKYQLITDFNTQITNYLKVTDFNTQITNYLKVTDFNTQIANYLKTNDFNTQIANYLKTNDFNSQIQNYLLINDYTNDKKNFVNQDYLQQYCKQNYLSVNIDKVTLLNSNYNIFTSQIQGFQTYMNNYALKSSLDQIINDKLQQYLLISPENNTLLDMNYKISKEQIVNFDTIVLVNYYNKYQVDYLISQIQANPVDLVNYYNKQQVDYLISQSQANPVDLSKYLLINDYDNQIKDYLLAQEYYTDRKRFMTIDYVVSYVDQYYLAKFVDEITLLNPNYNIIVSQIQDLNDYMGSNYYNKQQVDQQIQNNKQIVDLSNYYNKQQVDQQILNNKQIIDLTNYYNKQQVDQQIQDLNNYMSNYYNKQQVDQQIQNNKQIVDLSNYYNKQQVDQQILINKQIVDLSNYYNKQQVDQQIQNNKQIVDLSNYYNKQQVDYLTSNLTMNLSINYNNLGEKLRNLFVTGDTLSKCDITSNTVGTQQYQTPFGFTNVSYYYQNNVQQSTSISFIGPASCLMSINGLTKDYINYYSPQDSCYFFSNNSIGYPQAGCYGLSYVSTLRQGNNIPGPMFDGFSYDAKITIGGPNIIQYFQSNTRPGYPVSQITNTGQYIIQSDENLKDNIMLKTNYQEQLDKLLKLNIVTYSYGKNYDDLIKQKYQQLNDQNILQEDKDYILQQIDSIQQVSGIAIQGYTYQNLEECGFNYVLQNKQIMSDQYFDQKQYNKEKIRQNIQSQQTKSICQLK